MTEVRYEAVMGETPGADVIRYAPVGAPARVAVCPSIELAVMVAAGLNLLVQSDRLAEVLDDLKRMTARPEPLRLAEMTTSEIRDFQRRSMEPPRLVEAERLGGPTRDMERARFANDGQHVLSVATYTPSGKYACVCGQSWPCSQRPPARANDETVEPDRHFATAPREHQVGDPAPPMNPVHRDRFIPLHLVQPRPVARADEVGKCGCIAGCPHTCMRGSIDT